MYAIVTGASSGIGRELSFLLAENGYDLILVARREERLNKIKNQLIKYKREIKVFVSDLSILDNCISLFNKIKNLDIGLLINNAGFGYLGYFSETNLEKEFKMIDLNIKSLHILTKLFIQNFNFGNIVNIGSMAGFLPTPKHATYAATKSYVNYFSRAVNYELKRQNINIRVLTVAPGPVKTEFNKVANASIKGGIDVKICAKEILKGIRKRKELIIPGFKMKLIYFAIRFFPTRLLLKMAYKIQNSR